MVLQVRSSVLNYKRDSYLGNEVKLNPDFDLIDCAVGYSQWGLSQKAYEAFQNFDLSSVTQYGELFYDASLKLKILERFNISGVTKSNLFLGHGSFNLSERLIHKLINPTNMLGIGPQFNEIPSEFIAAGGQYIPIPIDPITSELPIEQLKSELGSGNYSVLYLDNPNNPLGYFLPLDEVRELVQIAEGHGTLVLVDEAYGDFIEDAQSAFHLVSQFSNLAVVRSMSKGLGLAAERVGYMFLSEPVAKLYGQLDVPFEPTAIAASLAGAAMTDFSFTETIRNSVRTDKAKIINQLKKLGITVLPNHPDVSIFSVYKSDTDLVQMFSSIGVSVEPGSVFSNLNPVWNDNYCRVRVPARKHVDEFCQRLVTLGNTEAKYAT